MFQSAIDMNTSQRFIAAAAQLVQQGTTELYVAISTPGGQVSAGITMYNVLRGLPAKIITHNLGNIDSIGNAIFLAGEERHACAHSTFMFHGVGIDATNVRLEEKILNETLHSLLADQKRIGDIIQDRTNLGSNDVEELFREARTKDAEAALRAGIVHQITQLAIPPGAPIISLVI
jgi:ATP-dependent protease ClpP protease subunit